MDLWVNIPQAELAGKSPAAQAAEDSSVLLSWLGKFQYPANFPMEYLLGKLGLPHSGEVPPISPETAVAGFLDAIVVLDWNGLARHSCNDLDYEPLKGRYASLLAAVPLLARTKDYAILHAGAADDGVSAMVMLELNRKHDWTVLLNLHKGIWKVKQNLNGSPALFYEQNKLFRALAEDLGQGDERQAWNLLAQNLPKYPDCADLYYYKALYHQLAKQLGQAKEDFLNAIALDNYYHEAIFALSALYLSINDSDRAQYWLEALLRLQPDDLNAQNNLAGCYAAKGKVPEAIKRWKQILATAPTYEPALKNIQRYES
jgi:tetratricopeptide (TPR) repeat protein